LDPIVVRLITLLLTQRLDLLAPWRHRMLDNHCQPTLWIDMQRETKSKQFALRMRPAVYEAGEQAAADDHRSLASLMEMLLVAHLRQKGYLPPEPARHVIRVSPAPAIQLGPPAPSQSRPTRNKLQEGKKRR
jgi:hypothetical protein